MEKKNLTVATALQTIELINLKIKENKRLAVIAADKFKTTKVEITNSKGKKEMVFPTDLRKCLEYNSIQTEINRFTVARRNLIMDTVV